MYILYIKYKYLNELEEKIRKLEKLPLMVFENNND